MTTFTGSPRLQKGALIGLDPANPLASMIIFQYNPETISRTLRARTSSHSGGDSGGQAFAGETMRLAGPPEESLKLEVVLDATDQLEKADPITAGLGIHPQLASLEMLLYPKSALVIANEALMRVGMLEVIQPEAPLAILVWGIKRILPVRLTGFSITEEMFDPNLNPIHARVSLDLNVLSYHDLGLLSPGGALFMAHQLIKEGMATINGVSTGLSAAGNFSASFGTGI
jgi:hypothetical protein